MKICICSSAGSANLLINSLNSRSYKYVIKNQSRDLLKSVLPKKNIISLSEAKKKGSTFFIGTGDEFSKDCIIKIKKKGKYVVSIFDHWINYEKRINKNFLPDEAWVYDEKAKKILKNIFPKLRIKQKKKYVFY